MAIAQFNARVMNTDDFTAALSATAAGVAVRVKVVPNASRARVAGMLGDRLKLAVAAPAEGGKANRAVCDLIAELLGAAVRDVTGTAGNTHPGKTLEVVGVSLCAAAERLSQVAGK